MLQATGYPAEISDFYSAISAGKKNVKQISVICLIERHKDNNDRSRKKSPNLYSPDHAYAWNFERTKFRNVHRLPPVTWVTYGKNFRCVVAKWVNRLNWKKPVSLVWSGKPVFMVSHICLKVLCKLVSANSKELKKLYNHWIGLPQSN